MRLRDTPTSKGVVRGIIAAAALSVLGSVAAPSWAYERPGSTRQVDVASNGQSANPVLCPASTCHDDHFPVISANGRYVAFASYASNLVPGDTNGVVDVFRHDLKTGKTEIVSVSSTGAQALGLGDVCTTSPYLLDVSEEPSISADGRYVAFTSYAPNLIENDTNGRSDVFVRDVLSGETTRISVAPDGSQAVAPGGSGTCLARGSFRPSIDANGAQIAFETNAINLGGSISPCGVGLSCSSFVYLRDLKAKTTQPVSVQPGSDEVYEGHNPSISGNGRYVAFSSPFRAVAGSEDPASTIGDIMGLQRYVFVRDLKRGETEEVSVASDGTPARSLGVEAWSDLTVGRSPALSYSGRYVVFQSGASNLVPNDSNTSLSSGGIDSFVHDNQTGRTYRVSVTSVGLETRDPFPGASPSVSGDGRSVAFFANSDRYGSNNEGLYLHDLVTGATELVSVTDDQKQMAAVHASIGLSADGRFSVFQATGTPDEDSHDYVHDRGRMLDVSSLEVQPHKLVVLAGKPDLRSGGSVNQDDRLDDVDSLLGDQGANLSRLSLAYRPQYEDLFVSIDLEHMPQVLPGLSPISYGLRVQVEDKKYEVRATSFLGGTFGLFDCTGLRPACRQVTDLRGGYGTTGMRVVFSLPLEEIGLEKGGELADIKAFSALGSSATGTHKVLDQVSLSGN